MMKIAELRKKNASELTDLLEGHLKQLCHLRLSKAGGELKQTHEFAMLRKKIAQIKTLQTEQKQAGETA